MIVGSQMSRWLFYSTSDVKFLEPSPRGLMVVSCDWLRTARKIPEKYELLRVKGKICDFSRFVFGRLQSKILKGVRTNLAISYKILICASKGG